MTRDVKNYIDPVTGFNSRYSDDHPANSKISKDKRLERMRKEREKKEESERELKSHIFFNPFLPDGSVGNSREMIAFREEIHDSEVKLLMNARKQQIEDKKAKAKRKLFGLSVFGWLYGKCKREAMKKAWSSIIEKGYPSDTELLKQVKSQWLTNLLENVAKATPANAMELAFKMHISVYLYPKHRTMYGNVITEGLKSKVELLNQASLSIIKEHNLGTEYWLVALSLAKGVLSKSAWLAFIDHYEEARKNELKYALANMLRQYVERNPDVKILWKELGIDPVAVYNS
ncbi:MAG: hypothetical protein LBR70_04275 [Lactobacillaceae bacterium]|jgi:hypothetical protein|nr:hypothetical protein [Lactobacillaceae bacterium]